MYGLPVEPGAQVEITEDMNSNRNRLHEGVDIAPMPGSDPKWPRAAQSAGCQGCAEFPEGGLGRPRRHVRPILSL